MGPCSFCSSLSGPWDSGPFCLTPEVQFSLPLSLWPRLQVTGFPSWQSWDKVGQGGLRLCPWEAGLPGAAPGDRWTRCTSLPTAEPDPARRGPCALLGIRKRREKNLPCGRGPAAGQHGWYCQGCWSTIWRLREQLLYLDL